MVEYSLSTPIGDAPLTRYLSHALGCFSVPNGSFMGTRHYPFLVRLNNCISFLLRLS